MIQPSAVVILNHLDAMLVYRLHQIAHEASLARNAGDPAHEHFVAIAGALRSAHDTTQHLVTKHVDPSDHSRPRATQGRSTGP